MIVQLKILCFIFQDNNDKEELVSKSDDERESSQEVPSILTIDENGKSDSIEDKGSLVGLLDGKAGSGESNMEEGPSETVSAVVEQDKKDQGKKKSFLSKVKSLRAKKPRSESQQPSGPTDEIDTPIASKDSGEKRSHQMLIKKLKSFKKTKKPKSSPEDETPKPTADVELELVNEKPPSDLESSSVPDETIQDQAVTSTASSPVEEDIKTEVKAINEGEVVTTNTEEDERDNQEEDTKENNVEPDIEANK